MNSGVCDDFDFRAYRDETGKNLSVYESIRPLLPALIEFAAFLLWVHYSSYDILRKHPRLFYFATGTVFSNISVCIIMFMYYNK